MKINPKYGDRIITIPYANVIDNLKEASEIQIKVLVFALANQNTTLEEIAVAVGCNKDEAKNALLFWKEKGAIGVTGLKGAAAKHAEPKAEEPAAPETDRQQRIFLSDHLPRYTEEEVAKKLRSNPELRSLIDECGNIVGDLLNQTKAGDIVVLYDYLHLSPEYIMLLFSHCAASGKVSFQYIKKVAVNLFNDGIISYEDLERHFESLEVVKGIEAKYRELFGIKGRSISPSERNILDTWASWGVSNEMLERAYDATVLGAENPSISYMNGVIKRWHSENLDTPEKVAEAETKYRSQSPKKQGKKQPGQNGSGSFDTKDFFEAALKRSYSDKK